MKKLGKILANLLIVAYAVIAIIVTVLLLSYNDYRCSVIGGYTFILVTDDELEEAGYPEGSLVLVKETKAKNINVGDSIFLYRNISATQFEVKYAEVLMKDQSKGEYDVQYVLEGNTIIDHEDVIGSTKNIKVIPHLGTILSILESRYGYLFLIVVVSFIAFLYEIYELIMEIKYGDREEDDEDYDDEEYDEDDYEEYEDDEEEEEIKPKKKATTAKKASSTTKKATSTSTAAKKKTTKAVASKGATTKTTAAKAGTTKKTTASATKKAGTSTAKTTTSKTTTAKKKTTQTK